MSALSSLLVTGLILAMVAPAMGQAPESPAAAFGDSMDRLVEKFNSAQSSIQSSRRPAIEKKRALEALQTCGEMIVGIRRQLAEYSDLERINAASASNSEQSKLVREHLRKKRNLLAPVIAGAAHELVSTALATSDQEVRRHCKEATDASIVALLVVAELPPIHTPR
jgi:hypothetical protein